MAFRKKHSGGVSARTSPFALESLETRRHLTLTTVFSNSGGSYSTPAGVSAAIDVTPSTSPYADWGVGADFAFTGDDEPADEATLTLSGLPAHTMAFVNFDYEV